MFYCFQGDNTVLVTAPKGRRGCISYIDFAADCQSRPDHDQPPLAQQPAYQPQHQLHEEEEPAPPPPPPVEASGGFSVEHNHPVYIPGVQYLPQRRRRTFTPLSQMQVIRALCN